MSIRRTLIRTLALAALLTGGADSASAGKATSRPAAKAPGARASANRTPAVVVDGLNGTRAAITRQKINDIC